MGVSTVRFHPKSGLAQRHRVLLFDTSVCTSTTPRIRVNEASRKSERISRCCHKAMFAVVQGGKEANYSFDRVNSFI
jgi:hypothetical protein